MRRSKKNRKRIKVFKSQLACDIGARRPLTNTNPYGLLREIPQLNPIASVIMWMARAGTYLSNVG